MLVFQFIRVTVRSTAAQPPLLQSVLEPQTIVRLIMEENSSVKDALLDGLKSILSADHNTRIGGEERVKALEVTDGKCKSQFIAQKCF